MVADDEEQLIGRAEALVNDVLWPAAIDIDRRGRIPIANFSAIAELGLFGMAAPPELGGLGFDVPRIRRMLRVLGRGCGATAFAFAQHAGLVAMLSRTSNSELRDRWLPHLVSGQLAGTVFAHARRAGNVVRATPKGDGWVVDGAAPWATSWGTAVAFSVAATTEDGRLVWFVLDGEGASTIIPSAPMDLVAFSSTITVGLEFRNHEVDPADVLSVLDIDEWRIDDRAGAVRPNPLCLGIGDRAIDELAGVAPAEAEAYRRWWPSYADRLEAAGEGSDPETDPERLAAIAAIRADAVFAVQRLTTALMAAGGGRTADRSHAAQLLARQALFYVIQAQNDDGRRATLDALAPPDPTE